MQKYSYLNNAQRIDPNLGKPKLIGNNDSVSKSLRYTGQSDGVHMTVQCGFCCSYRLCATPTIAETGILQELHSSSIFQDKKESTLSAGNLYQTSRSILRPLLAEYQTLWVCLRVVICTVI
jgi:hypothetical protein